MEQVGHEKEYKKEHKLVKLAEKEIARAHHIADEYSSDYGIFDKFGFGIEESYESKIFLNHFSRQCILNNSTPPLPILEQLASLSLGVKPNLIKKLACEIILLTTEKENEEAEKMRKNSGKKELGSSIQILANKLATQFLEHPHDSEKIKEEIEIEKKRWFAAPQENGALSVDNPPTP